MRCNKFLYIYYKATRRKKNNGDNVTRLNRNRNEVNLSIFNQTNASEYIKQIIKARGKTTKKQYLLS